MSLYSTKDYALVTGASGGIGECFAKLLAEKGKPCIICARSKDKLESLAQSLNDKYNTPIVVIASDLSNAEGVNNLISTISDKKLPVDVLINNAGFGTHGEFHTVDIENHMECIRLNCMTLVTLAHKFMNEMIPKKRGWILNVASTASYIPVPYMGIYAASKAFVRSFSETLHKEAQKYDIVVTALCPGPSKTNFQNRSGFGERFNFSAVWTDPQFIAQEGLRALEKDKSSIIPGSLNKLTIYMSNLVPSQLTAFIGEKILK